MCAYSGSDFAELTFDFRPNVGLQYSRDELRMAVSKVVCSGTLEGRTATPILTVTRDSPEIVTRFAVEMLNNPNTEAATAFHVSCDFTYAQYGGASRVETCQRDFSIKDCKGPEFETPNGECEFDACAGNTKAGLYEACGGRVVKAGATSTYLETGQKECCQGCADTVITCTALLDVPEDGDDLMRCESETISASSTSYYPAMLLTQVTQEHPTVAALLSISL